jgi:hypothetical protein
MIKRAFIIITLISNFSILYSQTTEVQSIWVIDCPSAATLERGSFMFGIEAYADGGILSRIHVGLTDRILLGISYGGTNVIGTGEVEWNPNVGVDIRYRLFNEEITFPAVSIGFNNQGRGVYIDSLNRYTEKSKGAFLAISKSYEFLGFMAIHGGINYSFEHGDGDKDISGYVGMEKSINEELGIYAEYDFALNDNTSASIGDGKGYLNAGLKWSFEGQLFIDFLLKNILKNNTLDPYSSREIRISFVQYF